MARTREFVIGEVVQKAMIVFWRQGYAATSMADIYEATGLRPGSVYAAFKDKEELFRQCFEAYAGHFRATLPADLRGIPAVKAWLVLQARLATDDPDRKGCLIINTVTERNVHSAATIAMANSRLQEIRNFFMQHLSIAIAERQIPSSMKIDTHADALLGAVVGIMALGRAGADERVIANVAKSALAALTR